MAVGPLLEIDSVFTFKLTVKSCGGGCFTNVGLCGITWRTCGLFVEMSFGVSFGATFGTTFSAIFGGASIAALKICKSSTGSSEALVTGTALIILAAGFKLGLEHALLLLLLEQVRMLVLVLEEEE